MQLRAYHLPIATDRYGGATVGSVISLNGKWRAQVRRKGHRAQCRTFTTKAQADAWVRQTEADIDRGVITVQGARVTVSELITEYRKLRERARPISDSSNEHYMLKALDRGLGDRVAANLTPDDFVAFATMRRDEGAGPYTINMDISKLGTVMRYGAAALRVSLPDAVGSARPLLTHLRLIGGGGLRERRPSDDELERVVAYMRENRGEVYADAVVFSACSAMRRGEVCGLEWGDIDPVARIATVARKHPRKGKTTERVPLIGGAWEVVDRQDRTSDRVFPIEAGTLSKYFTEACRALSIPDLHLHDLRHEGTSRLFESGLQIQEVALVTGHKSWAHLKRYTNLRPEDLTARQSGGPDQSIPPRPDSRPNASQRRGRSSLGKTPR